LRDVFGRIKQIIIKELIHVLRDFRMRALVFIMPAIQLLLLGYAVSTDVREIRTAVRDADNTESSRELIRKFTASGYFAVVRHAESERELTELLDSGTVAAAISINSGFERNLRAGGTATVQAAMDGSDSMTAQVAIQYATRITAEYSKEILSNRAAVSGIALPDAGLTLKTRAWFNENLESRNFYLPGVMMLLVTLISIMLTGMAVVREKEMGTLEQLQVTPISPLEFILGKTIPFAAIGFIDATIVLLVGFLWFEVPFRGDLFTMYASVALLLLATIGTGLLISSISGTQQQMLMTAFLFFMPAQLLSGFAFPIENMPMSIQYLTLANPLRHFIEIIRAVFLKGVGAEIVWPQMLALFIIGTTLMSLAWLRLRRILG
jgi:ABC-2 type transport system permease protein